MKSNDFLTMVTTYLERHDPSKKRENTQEKTKEFESLMMDLQKL